MDRTLLLTELTVDEGRRRHLYYDTTGHPTIGIGHNLLAKGVSDRVIDLLFQEDVDDVEADLDRDLAWWRTLDEVRQRVLANMAFNLGTTKLLEFQRTLAAVREAATPTRRRSCSRVGGRSKSAIGRLACRG